MKTKDRYILLVGNTVAMPLLFVWLFRIFMSCIDRQSGDKLIVIVIWSIFLSIPLIANLIVLVVSTRAIFDGNFRKALQIFGSSGLVFFNVASIILFWSDLQSGNITVLSKVFIIMMVALIPYLVYSIVYAIRYKSSSLVKL